MTVDTHLEPFSHILIQSMAKQAGMSVQQFYEICSKEGIKHAKKGCSVGLLAKQIEKIRRRNMATYVVIPINTSELEKINGIVKATFGTKCFLLPRGEWLVSFDGTSMQLCEAIGIGPDVSPAPFSAVVLNFSAYYGRASKTIWEWMNINGEK